VVLSIPSAYIHIAVPVALYARGTVPGDYQVQNYLDIGYRTRYEVITGIAAECLTAAEGHTL